MLSPSFFQVKNAGLILICEMSVYYPMTGTLQLNMHHVETLGIVRKGQQYDFINVLVFVSTIFKLVFVWVSFIS